MRPATSGEPFREATRAELCGRSGTSDIVDASAVVAAWSHGRIVVSDPDDLPRLDPNPHRHLGLTQVDVFPRLATGVSA